MSPWKDLIDAVKHQVYEENTGSIPDAPAPEVLPPTVLAPTGTVTNYNASVSVVDDSEFYARLVQQTSFDAAPNLQKVLAFAKPLESIIADTSLRMKAAFAQASASGVTPKAVLADIELLMSRLNDEGSKFKTNIDSRIQEIAQKEQQLRDLTNDVSVSKSKVDKAESGFSSARARRQSEIEQLKKEIGDVCP